MNTYKKIIVATDFSDNAHKAYLFARHFATLTGASLHVVNVYQPIIDNTFPEYAGNAVPLEEITELSIKRLETFVAKTDPEQGGTVITVTHESILGVPTDILIELSKAPSVNLMILGSVGEHDWLDRVWGSVSVNIARQAFCPVLLVPQNMRSMRVASILYAASLASAAPSVVVKAIDWATYFNATLHFVHINTSEIDKSESLFKIILTQKAPTLPYSIENRFADEVKDGIYDYCLERGVDMLIVYAHHYTFAEELMKFSVSKDLAWHTRLPILFIHPNDTANDEI